MVKLTVSIVNFNAGDYLIRTLKSLEKVRDEALLEIFVVDNLSTDNSIKKAKEEFKNVHFIENKENVGFGVAHNQVLENLKTDYVLILNPDVEIKKGVISRMLAFMDQYPEVGISTCKVVFPTGRIDLTAHRGFPTPRASLLYFLGNDSLYHLTNRDFNVPHEIDSVAGAFMLIRKEILEKVGLFDQDYFLYAEEIDLCFRVKKAGYKIMYVPDVKIVHYKGVSTGIKKHSQTITTATLETKRRALDSFYQTMKIFYRKHYEKNYPFFVNWLVYLAINLKWFQAKRKLVV